ncbi:Reverse transcriptase (RNA-dependent DNA polymerase) [Pseudovibrio sp. Ad46]|uniref:retron St85 family RNA-directed DNA polymerase n=1 Tax=Pseudovibrio sp. Ad46 TaxID=989432 RepID=UPI0007B17769|nr:retron St85 family RNA-directed DNA polymerase [Pseudovibrio sp. Ad46]KZK95863.1 Reverse transcriptase (RNA-dependent DNA polymerase) [Pseudovibrio sp. Ad46]
MGAGERVVTIIDHIQHEFGFSRNELVAYAGTCPHRYKTYNIRKRNGDPRTISQPSKDLKAVQRFIVSRFFEDQFVIHEAATAYRKGVSIVDNAKPHLNSSYLLKMDFKNFFPSIKSDDFVTYLVEMGIYEDEARILSRIFFKKERDELVLSIGAPSSPIISNALLHEFDERVAQYSKERSLNFTRYSDDITISTNVENVLFDVPNYINELLGDIRLPRLRINEEKTVFSSKKFNRHVTGITISNEGQASLGRSKKRRLKAAVHSADKLTEIERFKLRGRLAFAKQVDPKFIELLHAKYPKQISLINSAQWAWDLSDFL